MDARARWSLILDHLREHARVTVPDLCRATGVSAMTIRRDLEELERQGALRRIHGGATSPESRSYEPPFALRAGHEVEVKRLLGRRAAALVSPGDVVMLDSGTTCLEIARALADVEPITIVTPSLRAVEVLQSAPGVRLVVAGGVVRSGELSLIGDLAVQTLEQVRCDIAFLGVGGIDAEAGATEYNLDDTAVKRAATRTSRRRFVVADHSKVGAVALARICPIEQVDGLITDAGADSAATEAISQRGVDVLVEPAAAPKRSPQGRKGRVG